MSDIIISIDGYPAIIEPFIFENEDGNSIIPINISPDFESFTFTINDELTIPITINEPTTDECCNFGTIDNANAIGFNSSFNSNGNDLNTFLTIRL